MRLTTKVLGGALGAALLAGTVGCNDFISGVPDNTNLLTDVTPAQLFTAVQVTTGFWSESQIARFSSMWMNQLAGTDRQFTAYDAYNFGEQDVDAEFATAYGPGGLVDIRKARAAADSQGMHVLDAILKVHEAYLMGMTASIFGDIPYSEALVPGTPAHLDAQAAVYASLQTLLDQAITQLGTAATVGEQGILTAREQNFAGNRTKWTEVANTLKARYYMHWVEAQAAGGAAATAAGTACGGNCIAKALAAANSGISVAGNTWRTVHTGTATETNFWYQFQNDRFGYISGGKVLIDFLKSRSDPRLQIYYTAQTGGTYNGSAPGSSASDPGTGASQLNTGSGGFAAPGARIPIVSCAENFLIIAEAQYRLGATAAAQTALTSGTQCALAQSGSSATAASVLPAVMPTGAALFTEIGMQKYAAEFLNLEAWNDYKRTCVPPLGAAKVGTNIATVPIPGRLYYGLTERQTNPNVPGPDAQPVRNTNDPVSCATVTGLPGS